jgi:hypothetical protein
LRICGQLAVIEDAGQSKCVRVGLPVLFIGSTGDVVQVHKETALPA